MTWNIIHLVGPVGTHSFSAAWSRKSLWDSASACLCFRPQAGLTCKSPTLLASCPPVRKADPSAFLALHSSLKLPPGVVGLMYLLGLMEASICFSVSSFCLWDSHFLTFSFKGTQFIDQNPRRGCQIWRFTAVKDGQYSGLCSGSPVLCLAFHTNWLDI